MPIHDQSYRRYGGTRETPDRLWTVIARAGLLTLVRRRAFLALMLVAWIPFVVRAVQIYLASSFQQAEVLAVTPQLFRDFLEQQGIFQFLVTIYAGAGLIANDRRFNALQIYLSKPLSRVDYVAGKMAILLTVLLFISLVPALSLLLLQTLFSGSMAFLVEHAYLIPAIVLQSLVGSLVASFTMVALSSLTTSARYAGILYTGLLLFSQAVFSALRLMAGNTRMAWISLGANLEQVGDLVFRQSPRYDAPVAVSVVVLAGLVALSMSVLDRRIRGVEVVE